MTRSRATRVALLAASSLTAFAMAAPAFASAQGDLNTDSDRKHASRVLAGMSTGTGWTADHRIVTHHEVVQGPGNPLTGASYANSTQVLDSSGVNGVGQMIAIEFPFLGLCTGTLINPRTVITAAHCVYGAPQEYYGSVTGVSGGVPAGQGLPASTGIPISFGFEATNRCRGIAVNGCATNTGPYETWRDSGYKTQTAKHIYNANQVWYHEEALKEFGLGDIALVTLDTHVDNVPTWTLLFSPLEGPAHATITGYGAAGVGLSPIGDLAGIDYRRRVAENMVDALMSSDDWAQSAALGSYQGFSHYAHSLYWMDFDDPDYSATNPPSNFFTDTSVACPVTNPPTTATPGNGYCGRDNGYYDFNGLGGTALPFEGTTAGGDSGGPLIIDRTFTDEDGNYVPVVAGVLTGGWSFNGGIGTYGEFSVYPPLFLYWQDIVRQNPYKYVSAKAGSGDWYDPSHWVQDLDPAYMVIGPDGNLVNGLPSAPMLNNNDRLGRFGTLCYLGESCEDVKPGTQAQLAGGNSQPAPGTPGSTNFVPNNVEPVNSLNPSRHVWARYYDVTLDKVGTTTLGTSRGRSATIDRLTVEGGIDTKLNITSTGSLTVLGDFTQTGGHVNVDGTLTTGEAFLGSGLMTGSGTFDPTFVTVLAAAVAPGGAGVGTLTVKGDMIMSSASGLLIDVTRNGSDKLNVVADGANAGILALNGSLLITPGQNGAARYGDQFVLASAQGGISGAFSSAGASSGVLKPQVSYVGNQVNVKLDAGSLAVLSGSTDKTVLAFASALDSLRSKSYNKLWNLYGNVDWMNAGQLSATFSAMAPTSMVSETALLQDRQSRQLLGNVSDRLSLLGTGQAKGISFTGGAGAFAQARDEMSAKAQLGLTSGDTITLPVAGGLSGFVTMGGDNVRSSYGDSRLQNAGQHSRYFASGIEAPMGNAIVGTAMGFAESQSNAGSDEARSKLTQATAYATLPIGKNAYVGGLVAAERARTETNRLGTDTTAMLHLRGAGQSTRYTANAEAGFRAGIGHGLSVNPRAQVGFSRYSLSGLREQGAETALALNDLTVNRIESRIGARLDGETKLGAWSVRPNLQADYVRLLSGANNGMTVSFAAAPEYQFALPLTNSGSGWAELKGGIEMTKGKFTLGLSGQATAGDAPVSDQRGAIDLTFRF